MKRIFLNITVFCALVGMLSSCSKKIEENYLDPEKTAEGSLGKLLSGMYLNKRIHPSYWDYYTMVMPNLALYTQVVGTAQSNQMYVPSPDWNESRWLDFYSGSTGTDYNYNGPGIMSNYREMQLTYSKMNASLQKDNLVFLKCAQVLLYDQTAQMIDMWGDIPFSEAGALNTPDRDIRNAAFDDAKSLYDTLITNLKSLNTFFDTAALTPVVQADLTKQDPVMNGSLASWRRYANSLRLRLLMRISNVNESKAQQEISEMLADPATYPLVSNNDQNILFKESPTAIRSDIHDAFTDYPFAPQYLLNTVMVPNEDPRTEVFWDADAEKGFAGFPYNGGEGAAQLRDYAVFDSATFTQNNNVPGLIITAAEVSFLQAEAYQRWNIGDAAGAYAKGIRESIEFYYSINRQAIMRDNSFKRDTLSRPTEAAIANYLSKTAIAYTGTATEKLQKIWLQKWEHFFVLQAGQSWAELRRNDYPVLQYATVINASAPAPPTRFLYPSTEKLYNTANYNKVSAKDTRDTKIFWDVK